MVDASQSPAFALLTGNNFLARAANDAIFATNGFGALSVALVVDPRTVWTVGQTGVVVSKFRADNNQRQFKLTFDQSTDLFTISLWDDRTAASAICSRVWSSAVLTRSVLCFVYDGAGPSLDCYLDGVLANGALTGTVPALLDNGSEPMAVGAEAPSGTPANPWRGSLHMLAIWNAVLTPSEVATILYDGVVPNALQGLVYAPQFICEHTDIFQQYISILIDRLVDSTTYVRHFTGFAITGDIPYAQQASGGRLLVSNDWGDSFNDLGFMNQGLTSTYTSDPPFARWGVALTQPQRSAYRTDKHDYTILLRVQRVLTTVESIFIQFYGVQLRYVFASKEMYADVGDYPGSGNSHVSFGINLFPVEGVVADLVFRFNAREEEVDLFIGATKYAKVITATAAKYVGTALLLADRADFSRGVVIPECLSDTQVLQLQAYIAQVVHSFGPDDVPFTLFGMTPYPRYTPKALTPVAALPPLPMASVPVSSEVFSGDPSTARELRPGGVFNPYGVLDLPNKQFFDPLPVALTVTASLVHVVTATSVAGATNADPTIHWWEIELTFSGQVVATSIPVLGSFFFSGRNNDIRSFAVPLGQSWNGKRIRLVIRAASDAGQVWYSNYLTMNGPNFNNSASAGVPIYVMVAPVINTVSIDPGTHEMTMQGAIGIVTSDVIPNPPVEVWWEVEIRPGEYVAVIDPHHYNAVVISTAVNDLFILPLGTNFRGKSIRLVMAATYDHSQRVQSAPFLMADAAYDYNEFTPQPLPPGPGAGPIEPPPVGLGGPGVKNKRSLDFTTRR